MANLSLSQSKSRRRNHSSTPSCRVTVNVVLKPAKHLRGEVRLPGDKSITHRAMMIGALAEGKSEVVGFSSAADPMSTLQCFKELGVETSITGESLFIVGRGLRNLSKPKDTLDAGNSGTTIRLLTGILAGQRFESEITGDDSLRRRPMKRVIDPLTEMGARIESTEAQTPPLTVHPVHRLRAIDYALPVPSAQVKSAILLAGLHAEGTTRVVEPVPTRDHTERMLGLTVRALEGKRTVEVVGGQKLEARKFVVPGDISAATFFIVAACMIPNSEVHIPGVGLNPTRTAMLDVLKRMGADIEVEEAAGPVIEPMGNLTIRTSRLQNIEISPDLIPFLIDEVPALAVAGAVAEGNFEVRGARELRVKESDRIRSLSENLRRLGIQVEEHEDGLSFEGGNDLVPSGPLNSYDDHRIAMAMGVAGLVSSRPVEISAAECADISFPGFWNLLSKLSN
jgi:3-phosphoshikimate 1-carboxyvinyltransferase